MRADRRRTPAPEYAVGQQIWLSTRFVPLRTESKKLPLQFIGPFAIDAIITPVSVHLKLPRNMRIHNVFYVLQIKLVLSSPLCPPDAWVVPVPGRLGGLRARETLLGASGSYPGQRHALMLSSQASR